MTISDPERFLKAIFLRAVEVADPIHSVAYHLPERPAGRVLVVGAGKASARMAEAVEAEWGPCEGLVITRYGHARPCRGVEVVEAAHPVPDLAGHRATERMLRMLEDLGEDDLVLALISGGASSLLVAPAEGISLDDKQEVFAALLASGAPIDAMNTVRTHLSRVKGGQLAAAAYPARVLGLLMSDVPGDNVALIGSGPTVSVASTPEDAEKIVRSLGLTLPGSAMQTLRLPGRVMAPDDPRLSRVVNCVIAAPSRSLAKAAAFGRDMGCEVREIGDAIEGESRLVARAQAERALAIRAARGRGKPPLLMLSGGELTVTRRGNGLGGPNAEFCLALAIELGGTDGIFAIACDTDGIDGAAEVAGALIGPDTLCRARSAGQDAEEALEANDAHGFFASINSQVVTGPTLTNVNDFRAILIA